MSGKDLRAMLESSSHLLAFTGAGISAESGIPIYRGADGLWNKYDPNKVADADYFFHNPAYYWQFVRDVRYPALRDAAPNQGHRALAELERMGLLKALVTQNVDGLHQDAGSENVLELHGNTRRIRCLDCGGGYVLEALEDRMRGEMPPSCPDCGGLLKPDVVLFGESLPEGALQEAVRQSRSCDCFLAIGSSLVVQPAASLPMMAKQAGAGLVIVNKEETPLDAMADMVVWDSASSALAGVLEE
ncbi:MAG: NAD-dependent deacylase [Desulfohalobiaceae bacterium]